VIGSERLELLVRLIACPEQSRERVADQLLERRIEARAGEHDRRAKQVSG
jgi:hypothetical protein